MAGALLPRPPHDLVTHRDARDRGADLSHDTGEVAALSHREGRRLVARAKALADGGLSWVDARGPHLDDDLVGAGGADGDFAHLEHVYVAVPVELDCSAHERLRWSVTRPSCNRRRRRPVGEEGAEVADTLVRPG